VPVHLLILGERAGLAWVLTREQMAFAQHRRAEAGQVSVGDEFLLYTTRACFHNPTRDRGRVIGRAHVESSVTPLEKTVTIGGRDFELSCSIRLDQLLPRGEGVILSELVSELVVFPNPNAWSALLRRPVLTLPQPDVDLVVERLGQDGAPRATALEAVPTYLE
jgi:hypothetical protein